MNGGLLVQDCDRHGIASTHPITNNEVVYEITSTHHQMQYPYNLPKEDYDILYVAYPNRCSYYDGDKISARELVSKGEPEIVLYHKKGKPKCLAVQGHPEMMPDSPVAKMIRGLVEDLINENK